MEKDLFLDRIILVLLKLKLELVSYEENKIFYDFFFIKKIIKLKFCMVFNLIKYFFFNLFLLILIDLD